MLYNTIDIKNKKVFFCGDIHGNFSCLVNVVTNNDKYDGSCIIVCGDIGMGFYKKNYYIDLFTNLSDKLVKKNITLYMFRGNHDNPSYFNDIELNHSVSNESIRLIPDWTIFSSDIGNILCIGGAHSIDRGMRKVGVSWWEDEPIQLPIQPFNGNIGVKIDIICSHSAPDFALPEFNEKNEPNNSWFAFDDKLKNDLINERKLLTEIYNKLVNNGNEIKYWFYGHFHERYFTELGNGLKLIGLDMLHTEKLYYKQKYLKYGPDICSINDTDFETPNNIKRKKYNKGFPEVIPLANKVYLESVSNMEGTPKKAQTYKLVISDPFKAKYMTISYEEDNETIHSIDPEGGPYLCKGCNVSYNIQKPLSLHNISYIDNNFYLILKKI